MHAEAHATRVSIDEDPRSSGIGASEIAPILGISPFDENAWTIFARKRGLDQHRPVEPEPEWFKWGKRLQRPIAEGFAEDNHLPVVWCDRLLRHPTRRWQYASPDALIPTNPEQVLEVKTVGFAQLAHWDLQTDTDEGVPDYYHVQVQWQLSTLNLEHAYLAALVGGRTLHVYRIERDRELEAVLLETAEDFWRNYVLANVAPPYGASAKARDYIHRRFPRPHEKVREATPSEVVLLDDYAQIRAMGKMNKSRRLELETELKAAIGDAEGLEWTRGKMTWKRTRDSSEVDWEALAKEQIADYTEEQRKNMIEQHKHVKHGTRRIWFRCHDEEQEEENGE